MRITLYGIRGVYNFGCEAIVRGAYMLFSELYPESEISYYSYNYEYDSKMLKDIPVLVKKVKIQRTFFSRGVNKLLRELNSAIRILQFDYEEIIDDSDLIVSIGGDIYTVPEYLRQQVVYPYYNELIDFCNRAIKQGKKVVLYGASVGPFGDYKQAINYYKENLSKYNIIMCREEESLRYLQGLGMTNVCFFPDPAFQVLGKSTDGDLQYIGVNLSPLSLKEIYGSYDENNLKSMSKLLDNIYESIRKDILFIPHVLGEQKEDNDLEFMKKLQSYMVNKEHTHFADVSGGFLGLKPQIRKCYLVVSARMHCDINAIVENVPSIFLSYSLKSVGMCQYIYGNKEFVITLKKVYEELLPNVVKMLAHREEISDQLKKRKREIDVYYNEQVRKVIGI